jgi:ribosomal protein S26
MRKPGPTSGCYGGGGGEGKLTINRNYFPNSIHQTIFLIKTFCVLCSAEAKVVHIRKSDERLSLFRKFDRNIMLPAS